MGVSNIARIGADAGSLALVTGLTANMPGPIMDFSPYIKYDDLSSGHVNAGGLPAVTWEFRRLTSLQRDALAAFCPSLSSAAVTIYTRTSSNLDEYKAFNCILRWDRDESIKDYWRNLIKLTFIDCLEVEYTPP
jgi:hypothetical protein